MIGCNHRAWKILIKCEKFVGSWPYQDKIINRTLRIILGLLLFSGFVPVMIGFVTQWNKNMNIVMDLSIVLILQFAITFKLVATFVQGKSRQEILNRIAMHMDVIVEKDEVDILNDYYSIALFRITIPFFCLGTLACVLCLMLPGLRMYLLYLCGYGDYHLELPIPANYLVAEQKYFFYILIHAWIVLVAGGMFNTSFDLAFFLTVRHACALFEIVKLRLKKASKIVEQCNQKSVLETEKDFRIISSAVDLHNTASDLTQLIDETYRVTWFVVLLMNTINLASSPAMVLRFKNDPFELFRHFLPALMYLGHFYVTFLQGQLIIDYSTSVFDTCYEFCWYNAPKRSRVAISIMMHRSLVPNTLTGGNMFYLSMETYSVLLKTSVSYVSTLAALEA